LRARGAVPCPPAGGGGALPAGPGARLYDRQRRRVAAIRQTQAPALGLGRHGVPDFSRRVVRLRDFLPAELFARISAEVVRLQSAERTLVPAHKKGGTIAYETLIQQAPAVVAFYHAPELMGFFSSVVGTGVVPTPIEDQSSLAVLVYDRPADRIGWHYDHNFYRGRHFTALLTIVNQGHAPDGLSHARLVAAVDGW